MQGSPISPGSRGVLVAGARGSGKTSLTIAHARSLLDAGVPAWRILVVTFSPHVASRIAAHLPAEADAETAGGVWLQTAQRLCVRLLHECYRIRGQGEDFRVISAFERATLLHAAARRVAADLGPSHPLAPALGDTGGLAEIEVLLTAVAGQGGSPGDLDRICACLPASVPALDRAVLDGVARIYHVYRGLCDRVGGLTYQEVAARTAALLADPALAASIARRLDHLLIDDLDRAEPAQVEVVARIATRARIMASIDPEGVVADRAARSVELARHLLGLDVSHPTHVLPPPCTPSPAVGRLRARLQSPGRPGPPTGDRRPAPGPPGPRGLRPRSGATGGSCGPRRGILASSQPGGIQGPASPAPCTGGHHPAVAVRAPTLPSSDASPSLARQEIACDGSLVVAEELLDSAEAAYVARTTRAVLDEAGEHTPDGEPDVLILPPTPAIYTLVRAALRQEGIDVADTVGLEGGYDPGVRYVLAWLRVLVDRSDDHWERLLASPHARIPTADAARLRHWADEKDISLHQALLDAARGGCEPLSDASRTRLAALARLHGALRDSVQAGEAPSVTLHRLLAREDLVGALLAGPTDTGAVPPDPRGLAGLCALVARTEELWRQAYAEAPALAAVLDRVEQGLAHLLERAEPPPARRVVLANPDAAIDWRARVVIIPGLSEATLPRPRARSRLLSDAALAHLRPHWALPWPADVAAYADGERRVLSLAVAAARERIVLTRALRYEGEEAAVPSPLLLDALGAARIDPETCRAAGARLDQWTVTHEERPPGAVPAPGGEWGRARRAAPFTAQTPQEAARDLDTVLYRYVHVLAARDREHAASFIAEARAILADADAPARGRFLTLDDPFAALPAAPTALQAGARLSVHAVNDFLYCPRRFFYGTVAAIRAPATTRMHFGLLLVRAVQALLHLRPAPCTLTPEDAEDVLRLLWHGEEVPGAGPDEEREAFAGRFGTHLNDEAARALAQRALHRLARAESPAARGGLTCATGVPVEVPIALPDGRTVHLTAKVDRITRPPAGIPPKVGSAAAGLALIDYRSGASDATPDKVIGQFLDRKGSASWRPMDYTLPILFLGVAGNREVYVRHNLPLLPVRRLAIVALGADRDGCPHVCTVEIADQPAGKNELTPADLDAVRAQIAATVAEAAHGPHRPVPRNTFNPCRGCAHRFACPGPEMTP